MRYCSFSADHFKPDQARVNMNQLKRARKLGHEYTPEYLPSGNEYDWDDVGVPPVAAKSAKEIVNSIDFYSDEDVDLIDDPFTNPEFLVPGNKNGKKKKIQTDKTKGMGKKKMPELSSESDDSDDSGSYHTETEDSVDETDLSEDSDDSDDDNSSDVDVNSDDDDSDDTGEEDDDSDEDDDDSDSDDESDDDSDDSDGDSDDEPDTDDDDEEEDDEDEDDEDSDTDDSDDEDDDDDDDDDDIDDEEDSDDDDTEDTDTDYDDSEEEDDDEEDNDDEDSIDSADEEEDEPVKVPYGSPRKGKGNVRNSSNFTTGGHKGGFDETQYAEKLAVAQSATMASESNHWRLPFTSTTLFGAATNNKSELSRENRFSSMPLRDLLNPIVVSSSRQSGDMDLETKTPTSFFSWLKYPQNLSCVEKNEQMRLFK